MVCLSISRLVKVRRKSCVLDFLCATLIFDSDCYYAGITGKTIASVNIKNYRTVSI